MDKRVIFNHRKGKNGLLDNLTVSLNYVDVDSASVGFCLSSLHSFRVSPSGFMSISISASRISSASASSPYNSFNKTPRI